jgi:hypothetical protein
VGRYVGVPDDALDAELGVEPSVRQHSHDDRLARVSRTSAGDDPRDHDLPIRLERKRIRVETLDVDDALCAEAAVAVVEDARRSRWPPRR